MIEKNQTYKFVFAKAPFPPVPRAPKHRQESSNRNRIVIQTIIEKIPCYITKTEQNSDRTLNRTEQTNKHTTNKVNRSGECDSAFKRSKIGKLCWKKERKQNR